MKLDRDRTESSQRLGDGHSLYPPIPLGRYRLEHMIICDGHGIEALPQVTGKLPPQVLLQALLGKFSRHFWQNILQIGNCAPLEMSMASTPPHHLSLSFPQPGTFKYQTTGRNTIGGCGSKVQLLCHQRKGKQPNTLLTPQCHLYLLRVTDMPQNLFHLLPAHTNAIVCNNNPLQELGPRLTVPIFIMELDQDAALFRGCLLYGISRVFHELLYGFMIATADIG